MRLIKPSYEIWEQPSGLEGIYKQIERAAKVCYKSEGNITEGSAKPFIDNVLIKKGHLSPLEHGTVYLYNPGDKQMLDMISRYSKNPYSRLNIVKEDLTGKIIGPVWITTNYRTIIENNWNKDLVYRVESAPLHPKRITVHFILSRSIAQEYTRHRVFSFAMESQRYCNYSKNKFDNEITFIKPCWTLAPIVPEDFRGEHFLSALENAEKEYLYLVENGWKPQQAREVLPNACKTELVMTGFVDDWKQFFELRCAPNAHPQARELAIPLRQEFIDKKIW